MDSEGAVMASDAPVSPTGQFFNSSVLSVNILAVFESEIPIDNSPALSTLENIFMPISPRFSSIMVRDARGVQKWRKVVVNLNDHVKVPIFPAGAESYDDCVKDYISNIALEELPQNRPLWDLHLLKYPTNNAAGTMVFRLHHALGDGFSLMGALFSCVRRADNPSLPLTYPSARAKSEKKLKWWEKIMRAPCVCINTARDFGSSLLKSTLMQDDRTPIRSGEVGVEFRPISISTLVLSLDDIRMVKAKLGGTVNDIIAGTIFYGVHLYNHEAGRSKRSSSAAMTTLVLLNTRVIGSYKTLEEMNRPDAKAPWGNHFALMHVPLPKCKNVETADPLHFVVRARKIIKAKRSSLGIVLVGIMLDKIGKIKGPEVASRLIHQTIENTSLAISNMIGPLEQMIIADHPVRNLYFMTSRVPMSLNISVTSYMGKLTVAMGTEKGFIDAELLVSCMEKSFQKILAASSCLIEKHSNQSINPSGLI